MIAGQPGAACNRGSPPTIGVGLMRKLEKQFVVALTPEAYTSKTCCHCLGPCGAWKEVEEKMGKTIRGLRRCQNEECTVNGGLPLNRDKNGAINIGTNFKRLFEEKAPIRSMTDEDIAFRRSTTSLACNQIGVGKYHPRSVSFRQRPPKGRMLHAATKEIHMCLSRRRVFIFFL